MSLLPKVSITKHNLIAPWVTPDEPGHDDHELQATEVLNEPEQAPSPLEEQPQPTAPSRSEQPEQPRSNSINASNGLYRGGGFGFVVSEPISNHFWTVL